MHNSSSNIFRIINYKMIFFIITSIFLNYLFQTSYTCSYMMCNKIHKNIFVCLSLMFIEMFNIFHSIIIMHVAISCSSKILTFSVLSWYCYKKKHLYRNWFFFNNNWLCPVFNESRAWQFDMSSFFNISYACFLKFTYHLPQKIYR